ncbi:hypothetical protein PV326_013442 [Microctonus aethiopoides]|nr:hypothetical protein PV326_013442 [Microctonus aethiopoides]
MQESQELLRTRQIVMEDFLTEIFPPDEVDINCSIPDEPEAPDELPGEEGLANLRDPPDQHITCNMKQMILNIQFSGPQLDTCPTTTSALAKKMREERMLLPQKK